MSAHSFARIRSFKPSVCFVYSKSKVHWGSTTMRAHQLANLVRPYLAEQCEVSLNPMPSSSLPWFQYVWAKRQKAGSVLIFTKYAASKVLPETLAILKSNDCFACYDYVDGDLNAMRPTGFDVHIAASYAAKQQLIDIQKSTAGTADEIAGTVMLLLHNADERLYQKRVQPLESSQVNITYLGSRATVFLTPEIERQLTYLDASNDQTMRAALDKLTAFNFHYCVRAVEEKAAGLVCKPFTKGFNAALLGANLMVHRSTDDAVEFLGHDYPYFIDSTTEDAVLCMIEHVRSSYRTAEWRDALGRVKAMGERVSPQALAKQIQFILSHLGLDVRPQH